MFFDYNVQYNTATLPCKRLILLLESHLTRPYFAQGRYHFINKRPGGAYTESDKAPARKWGLQA